MNEGRHESGESEVGVDSAGGLVEPRKGASSEVLGGQE